MPNSNRRASGLKQSRELDSPRRQRTTLSCDRPLDLCCVTARGRSGASSRVRACFRSRYTPVRIRWTSSCRLRKRGIEATSLAPVMLDQLKKTAEPRDRRSGQIVRHNGIRISGSTGTPLEGTNSRSVRSDAERSMRTRHAKHELSSRCPSRISAYHDRTSIIPSPILKRSLAFGSSKAASRRAKRRFRLTGEASERLSGCGIHDAMPGRKTGLRCPLSAPVLVKLRSRSGCAVSMISPSSMTSYSSSLNSLKFSSLGFSMGGRAAAEFDIVLSAPASNRSRSSGRAGAAGLKTILQVDICRLFPTRSRGPALQGSRT